MQQLFWVNKFQIKLTIRKLLLNLRKMFDEVKFVQL